MRPELFIFKSVKEFLKKLPILWNLFLRFESYLFDIYRFIDLRRYQRKDLKLPLNPNEKIIMRFKKIYERNNFDETIDNIIKFLESKTKSAWKGHQYFAMWLVKELKPTIIVDLGVDKGFSTYIFAAQKIGMVYGIDWFMGMTFHRDGKNIEIESYIPCMRIKRNMEKKFKIKNVTIIQGTFSEVAEKWKIPIDILHIDGTHFYGDVKEDYQNWSKYLNENSVVLFHDTNVFEGVKQFFDELELPKYNFTHSYGLGVVSKNEDLISKIKKIWDIYH